VLLVQLVVLVLVWSRLRWYPAVLAQSLMPVLSVVFVQSALLGYLRMFGQWVVEDF
jgi:hypothetical protein